MAPPSSKPTPAAGASAPRAYAMSAVVAEVALAGLVFGFVGWLITRGYTPYAALGVAAGGVAITKGITLIPRGLTRVAAALRAVNLP